MQAWHMSGAGNDFMVVDVRQQKTDLSALSKRLCAMVGADGLMAVDLSENADFRLHFYNSDGSRGEMCGNGSRCICRFAFDQGIAGAEMTVESDAGTLYGWRLAQDRYRVQLQCPSVLDLHRTEDAAYVELGDPGIPHAVVELPELEWDMLEALRPRAVALRHDPAFPKGVNVSFYRVLDRHQLRVLTYERGVEDYTLACGTGCASIACVLHAKGLLPAGVLTAHNRGGILGLQLIQTQGRITSVMLDGPVTVLKVYQV